MTADQPHILFSTGAVYVYPLRAAFWLARASGCEGVELVVCPELLVRGPRAIRRLARQCAVSIEAIHPPLFSLPGWRKGGPVLPALADLARSLEIPAIVIHPPRAKSLDDPLLAGFRAQIAEARRRLAGAPTEITLENPGFFVPEDRENILWHLPALHRFAEEEGLRLTLDTTHAGVSPYPLPLSYEIARDRLAHIHLSDLCVPPAWLNRPGLDTYVKHHQLPGAGQLPLATFLHNLARDGFGGSITLEISPVSLQIWAPWVTRRILVQTVSDVRNVMRNA